MNGCRRTVVLPENIEAHYIKYQIEYLEDKAGDIPTRILPDHMDSYYTKYYVLTRIEGFFNQFSLIQIADLRHKQVTSLLNFFGNKVYNVGDPGELPAGIVPLEKTKYNFTGETSDIGGLKSERIEVDTGMDQYSIFSTSDFSIKRPNISTPYSDVGDPLTDFRIQLSLLKMHLTCSEFAVQNVASEMFTIPEGYRRVSHGSMEQIINSLFTKD
jgi:hypothetical protein